jgi:hypothetical protein
MKSARLTCVTGLALFTLLTLPVQLTAQQHRVDGLSSLPQDTQASVSAAMGRDIREYQAQARSGGFKAENAPLNLAAEFSSQGVTVRGENVFWKIALRGYGYGADLKPQKTVAPRATLNRVEYHHGSLTEWYVKAPLKLMIFCTGDHEKHFL